MTTPQMQRSLMIASIVYGALVAILAVLGADFMPVFAAIGAIVLGACWAITGYLRSNRPSSPQR